MRPSCSSGNYGHCDRQWLADVDGDGDLDFFFSYAGYYRIYQLMNDGNGGWSTSQEGSSVKNGLTTTHKGGMRMAFADLDGNGSPDLVTGTSRGNPMGAKVYLNMDGQGGFEHIDSGGLAVGTSPTALVTGDVNGDGTIDVVVASASTSPIAVYLNDPPPVTFSPAPPMTITTDVKLSWGAVSGDFNSDGSIDIISLDHKSGGGGTLYTNDGYGNPLFDLM